jgi:hypothetical protein
MGVSQGEAGLAEQRRGGRALPVVAPAGAERAVDPGRPPCRRSGDALPELPQPGNAPFRRVAGNDGGVYRSDGDAGEPIRRVVGGRERLEDAGLVAAEGAAALQDERDLLVVGGRPGVVSSG